MHQQQFTDAKYKEDVWLFFSAMWLYIMQRLISILNS